MRPTQILRAVINVPPPASGFVGAIGNTPLIRLNRLSQRTGCSIYGKAEFMNPGGSVKDRAALYVVKDAEEKGLIRPGGTIVEGTAGNTGIGLAHVCQSKGYNCVIYMPNTQSQEKIDLLRMLGAEVYPVPAVSFDNPQNYNHQAKRHAEKTPNSVWTNQFDNVANRQAHIETTGPEIWEQLNGKIDGFTCATGTAGTLAGVTRYLKEKSDGKVKSFLADPPGSVLYSYIKSGGKLTERSGGSITEGIGQGRVTENLKPDINLIDDALHVPDELSIEMVYRLLDEEGLYMGASSALNVVAAEMMAKELGAGNTIVTILCDGAYRYQTRLFSKKWLESKGLRSAIPDHLQKYAVSGGGAKLPDFYAEKLSDPSLDPKYKVQQASELRDSIEVFQATDYQRFLSKLVPIFLKILGDGQPIFVSTIPEQKLRVCILEILHRLPLNDHYKEYAKDIMTLLMQILRTDNEENAVLSLKIMIDLHRNYKNVVADQVQPFLDFVFEMYQSMPTIVKDTFETNSTMTGSTPAATPAFSPKPGSVADELEGGDSAPKTLAKSITSFKTLTECPIIVVLLLQIHRNVIATNMQRLVPLIMEMLALQAGPQADGHAAAAARGEILTGPAPGIRNKALFGEFIICQVKTMSLLAFLLRNPNDVLKSFKNLIPEYVVRLLKDCPPELSSARKELLVATRHVLSTDFRGAFLTKIDILSNEKVLVGAGITSHETLRPLAYSMLADLLHHVRAELDSTQLRRTIAIYSANLHDESLAPSIQTMCAKLLLNLVDRIIKLPDLKDARVMLLSILDTFKVKFEELNRSIPKQKDDDAMDEDSGITMRDVSERRPIKTLTQSAENPPDPIKDGRYLFRNLVSGFKTLLFGLRSCNPPPPPQYPNPVQWGEAARVTKPEEVRLMIDLFRECAEGFQYWAVDRPKIQPIKTAKSGSGVEHAIIKLPGATSREEKDSLDAFATFFMHLDPAVLHEIFQAEMDNFFTQMLRNPALVSIPQSMLAADTSTSNMCTILLNFLMKQLPTLGDDNGVREVLMITLLRLCFMSVTLFPEHNETVLVPHLGELMTSCIKKGASAKVPANYYVVLQMLFKNIGVGRFELLYKEVLPLMQNVLESLNSLLESARKQSERDLYAELCLTFPVRLSVLLPYLSYLMKPLVHALYGPPSLVSQALRTLELCVDNLTSDFLDPILNPVISDLMTALRSHLKPSSAGGTVHAHIVVRILGKFGGRNRQYLSEPSPLKFDVPPENDPGIAIEFSGYNGKQHFNHLKYVDLALKTIQDPKLVVEYKRQAFNFLKSSLYAFVPQETIPDNFAQMLRDCSDGMVSEMPESSQDKEAKPPSSEEPALNAAIFEARAIKKTMIFPSSWPRRYGTENFLDKILQGIFYAITVPEMKDEVQSLIFDFCQYFAVLEIAETNEDAINTSFEESGKTYRADGNLLSPHVLVEAIVESLCSDHVEVVEFATQAIQKFIEAAVVIVGPQGHVGRLSMFNMLAIKFRHYCYRREWYYKAGGCRGIEILSNTSHFDTAWLLHYELDFMKALLFIIKDVPAELSPRTNDAAKRVLSSLLAKCNSPEISDRTPESAARFTHLLQHLVLELSDRSAGARETVQDALRQLSTLKEVDLHSLLQDPKELLLQRMWSKPLRTLHFHNQIASIDALNFCFGIQPPIIEQTGELARFLQEVVQTADAEDEELIPQSRMSQHRNASALVELRIACLELLSTVMSTPSFVQNNSQLRATIIGIFFKYLYWKNQDVINAASKGLRRLVSQNTKLPKELLQAGLKPILMNMADHKRLTVEGLEGLAILLELLNSYFKVEIGKKLLDHLKSFLEPVPELHEMAKRSLDELHPVKILKSIVNVFHLLPTGANMFLVDLINIVMDLEVTLRRTHYSPFRTPLLKFLNRYPSDSWDHFGMKLGQGHFGRLYSQILADRAAAAMRDTVQKDRELLLQRIFSPDTETPSEQILAAVNGLHIIRALTDHNSEWIAEDPDFVAGLLERTVELAEKGRASPMEEDNLQVKQAIQAAVEVFVAYLKQHPQDIRFFLDLTSAISSKIIDLYPAYSDFLFDEIVSTKDIDLRRQYLKEGFQLFSNRSAKQEFKTFVFRHLINPILIVTYSREEKLVDKSLITMVNKDVWKLLVAETHGPASDDALCKDDPLKLEVIQMSTLLIYHSSTIASEHRKDIIKLGYVLIKMDDITIKYAAYVLIANFIAKYDCPPKIPTQIYVALLKAHQQEAKALVRQALDTMAPVLPQQLPLTTPQNSYRVWPRRVIGEDSQNIGQLVNVFQFLVRQSDLFYDHRELYMPQFINSLPRLAFVQNANHETKALAIDMVETIYKWEKRRLQEMQAENGPAIDDTPKSAKTPGEKESYTTPLMLREATITFLIRFTCLTPDASTKQLIPLSKRTVDLVRDLMAEDFWPEVNVKLTFFERNLVMNEATDAHAGSFVPALEVLSAILQNQNRERIVQSVSQLGHLLGKSLRSESTQIQEALQPLLRVVLAAVAEEPVDEENDTTQFINTLVQVAQDNFANFTNLNTAITILEELLPSRPDILDTVTLNLIKVFQKLVKDHITPPPIEPHPAAPNAAAAVAGTAQTENAPSAPAVLSPDMILSLMFRIIEILKSRLARLGEHRRWFLSSLVSTIERSNSADLCRKMLMVAREWTLNYQESFPSAKEKTAVIIKMNSFEGRGDNNLVNDYLRLILEVYENPETQRTELTTRLEPAFMFGVRCDDYELRNKFVDVFSKSMSNNIFSRLNYIIAIQNWEYNAQYYWISAALSLLMGSIVPDRRLHQNKLSFVFRRFADMKKYVAYGRSEDAMQVDEDWDFIVEDKLEDLVSTCRRVIQDAAKVTTGDLMEPLRQLQYLDDVECHRLWVALFADAWHVISKRDRNDLKQAIIPLLSQEFHARQMEKRPNIVITLMEGVGRCSPVFKLPPHLVKFLGTTYNAWYVSLNVLEEAALNGNDSSSAVRDSNLDALAEMYAALGEEDMFYGLWRRRCVLLETNAAMSFEQNGMWDKAMQMYETAQVRARTGALAYSESEYHLWEDHWIRCAQKLQQWELLSDIANKENYSDLLLECAWRMSEWTQDRDMLENHVNSLMEFPTPRRQVFSAYIALQKQSPEFPKLVEEGTQLSLKKWYSLPPIVTQAHTPLFGVFQQYVELGEAREIFASLQSTNAQNLDTKSAELKTILQTWRERLPNIWEDINMWSDLVSWRQLVFAQINRTYLPLVRDLPGNAGGTNSQASAFAYRGYHETAWIINRFAHVARKHQLPEVCINQLTKIYTLPNIEIQEAFLKLREQAKCYYYNNSELNTGLEVISNTNLMYFVTQQKAEFYTLKGMFLAKLKQDDEANSAFATAVQIDLSLAKAWAEWGHYNDRKFKESNVDLTLACHAVGCYLQAASLFKNGKARKVLARVLWLMSLDDEQNVVSKAWAGFKGEVPVWYWITFIPQLLTSLSHREARNAKDILIRIAKIYPQSLYFQLRTSREDYLTIRAQLNNAQKREAAKSTPQGSQATQANINGASTSPAPAQSPSQSTPKQEGQTPSESQQVDPTNTAQAQSQNVGSPSASQPSQQVPRKPWEYVEDILRTLRTAYPLLVVSMEGIVDSINTRFKCPWDEDSYRLIVALLNDGISYMGRLVPLPQTAKINIKRFSDSRLPKAIKPAFEADFVFPEDGQELTLKTYVRNLRKWRDHFEEMLDQRPQKMYLEQFSPWLSDFQFQKFDEVEVPGQYLQHKDNNADFIKIDRILPVVDNVRGHGISYKRLTFRGHDGSLHPFAVQYPAARHCRREERIAQLLRMFNEVLARKKESRRRNLFFSLPAAFPLSPHIRMVEDDISYISLHQVYEDFCNRSGVHKDQAIDFYVKSVEEAMSKRGDKDTKEWLNNVKMEIIQAIRQNIVPDTFLLDFFKRTFTTFPDLWLFRKQFTFQYATIAFQTYLLAINNRYPQKLFFSRSKGNVWNTEMLPSLTPKVATIINKDSVPFRYTPNIQTFIGEVGLEGLFSCAIMAVARCLSEPEFEMDQYLSIFIRDELITWYTSQHIPAPQDAELRNQVTTNVELVVRRLASLVKVPGGNLPANQTIIDHISQAVDPLYLAQMDLLWMPWI